MIARIRPYTKYIALILTIILVALLLTQVSLKDVITTLTQINPLYLLAGFVLYTCTYFFRAWRFHVLLNNEVSLGELFNIECVHNMMNNLLPARTGELSYVYLLKKKNNRTTGDGLATLLVARILDFIGLAIIFFVSILLIKDVPGIIRNALWLIALFTIVVLVILAVLLFTGRAVLAFLQKIAGRFHIENNRVINYLLKKGNETVESLEKIQIKKGGLFLIVLSLLIWGLNYVMVYLLITGMNVQFPFLLVTVGCTFILLTTLLPIQGLGGFGTTETVWTLVFVPLGMSLNDAIISGFCYHIILIFYFIILGIYGWNKTRS
ncbi:lysylphosphatidylglycerol synthase transmembrane domain-containing protein [Methanoregula sp.]|uniref:lysylphosphatidylglycerol synthase transmembrane domain-containing protein n=1 Tax=Methanoregula sp. TaxID=2052170 RepID=UPI0035643043